MSERDDWNKAPRILTTAAARKFLNQLATMDDGKPCCYGHMGCSTHEGGPCCDETMSNFPDADPQ